MPLDYGVYYFAFIRQSPRAAKRTHGRARNPRTAHKLGLWAPPVATKFDVKNE